MTTALWCGLGVLVYFAIALPLALWFGRRLHEVGKYYPEVRTK